VVVYSGESKLSTQSDQTGEEGYAVGFQGLVQYVKRLADLMRCFGICEEKR